ncbi:MAG: DUF885 domain-containing protein [Thermoplasmata archaeon]
MVPHLTKRSARSDPSGDLAALTQAYWEACIEDSPVFATALGLHGHDDRLSDIAPAGRARWAAQLEDFLDRAQSIPDAALSPEERTTRSELLTSIGTNLDDVRCDLEAWTVDPLSGPVVSMLNIESYQPAATVDDGRNMVARWCAMGPYVDEHVANLRRGLTAGKVAVRTGVTKVIEQIDDLTQKRIEEWPLLKPLHDAHGDWPKQDREAFQKDLTAAVRDGVRPAFLRLQDVLRKEILPRARPDERPGILHIPDGIPAYRRLIHSYTALDLSPEEVHATGLREVARINREMEELGEKVLGTRDRREILKRLRTDPQLYFRTRDEVEEKAREALARARAAIPRFFGRLPKADCEVVRMEAHEEKHSTIAYYRWPATDGSRPGRYFINTSAPETRPRYEAEVLAYHESIPGHHLQLAIAQELDGLPEFRKHLGVTAFVEGWGLYTERLSDEMGLYTADLDRIGVLSYDAWRACRLAVDTGMHAKGWTRTQAIEFMLENTALAQNNIVNEVDRYIAWPGQALAYKIGQLEIRRLRADAERRLGSRFDLRAFHDAVLGNGAVSLETLRESIDAYIRKAGG